MKFIASLLLLFMASPSLWAGVLKGKILRLDEQPISYATISVAGHSYTAVSNEDGEYSLKLPNGTYTIKCEAMLYQSAKHTVSVTEGTTELNITLKEESFELEGTTISAKFEDRAIGIMRKVIANRKKHAQKMQTLSTDIYLKGTMRFTDVPKSIFGQEIKEEDLGDIGMNTDRKGLIYALEQVTKYWYKAPNKEYYYVESIRESGNNNGLGFAQMPPIINIYDNNLEILSGLNRRGFISPASDNAFFYYNFNYMGSYNDGDYEVHKIKVTPKRKYEPLFSGYIYVVEGQWLFQSVELKLDKTSQIDLVDTLILEQYFRPRTDDVWLINTQTITPKLSLMGFKGEGTFVTSYMNVKVNQPIADTLFKKKELTRYDTAANDKDSNYWNEIRPIPLEKDEIRTYVFQDSVATENRKPDTSKKTKRYYWNLASTDAIFTYSKPHLYANSKLTIDNPIYNTGFNTVEGWYTGVDLKYSMSKYNPNITRNLKSLFTATLENKYGFAAKLYNPLLNLDFIQYHKDWNTSGPYNRLHLKVGSRMRQYNIEEPISPLFNSLFSLIGGENYAKLLQEQLVEARYTKQFPLGFKFFVGAGYYRRIAWENQTDFSWHNQPKYTSNLPENLNSWTEEDAFLIKLGGSYNFGQRYIQYPKYKSAIKTSASELGFGYVKGISGIGNSSSDFDKWYVYFKDEQSLKLLGRLNYNIGLGGFLNAKHVHFADYTHLNGNQIFFASEYNNSFQLAPYYRYSNTADIYAKVHAEWQMAGWLSNKIPLFRRLNWHFVAGTNAFLINKDDYYIEGFAGIDNIGVKMFRFLRVDGILGYESNIAKPTFGVRLGVKLNGLSISL